jgi:hypothetical protein
VRPKDHEEVPLAIPIPSGPRFTSNRKTASRASEASALKAAIASLDFMIPIFSTRRRSARRRRFKKRRGGAISPHRLMRINGCAFALGWIDARVPLGDVEIWDAARQSG